MPAVAPVRHRAARVAALIIVALTLGAGLAPVDPAVAAPPARQIAVTDDPEGGTPALRAELEAASKGYLDAKRALTESVQRQEQLTAQLETTKAQRVERTERVEEIADLAYRTGPLRTASVLLDNASPANFLDRVAALEAVVANEDQALHELQETQEQIAQDTRAVDAEIIEQRKQETLMAKRKQQAEKALAVANEQARAEAAPTNTSTTQNSASAAPAPRNPDGSWPAETCSVNDPTPADGCITPRTLHALNEAKAAGFTRYVSCFRSGGSGEHPKGRACDFAAQQDGFGGDATGGDRTYGNNLAAFLVDNADQLAVLYVIWYRQIWLPSSGWTSYSGAAGDPSSDHTNHVHLSVY
ncbi:hypothetical protein Strop_3390 [Salinispora tropica CNB-440]|uniref:ARB-07466-like C-terminal domain-containing protein n=1 Tax=Salinispora tropica (strain ATCC BAA-916 / DSM 44818 / JCM 13857 / NBRC 105044 / CNB-440) TaxID=369723 RepID=A4XA77_SALTO|nr:hypothetical protein Strop_3390 [Salinispora tropica CNB-440]